MLTKYPEKEPESSPHLCYHAKEATEGLDTLEREACKLGDPELQRIVERVKTSQACLARGEPVPREALRELIAFVRRNEQPELAEVSCG